MNLGDKFVASNCVDLSGADIVHRWILSRLNAAIQTTISAFERYEFSPGTTAIHSYVFPKFDQELRQDTYCLYLKGYDLFCCDI